MHIMSEMNLFFAHNALTSYLPLRIHCLCLHSRTCTDDCLLAMLAAEFTCRGGSLCASLPSCRERAVEVLVSPSGPAVDSWHVHSTVPRKWMSHFSDGVQKVMASNGWSLRSPAGTAEVGSIARYLLSAPTSRASETEAAARQSDSGRTRPPGPLSSNDTRCRLVCLRSWRWLPAAVRVREGSFVRLWCGGSWIGAGISGCTQLLPLSVSQLCPASIPVH